MDVRTAVALAVALGLITISERATVQPQPVGALEIVDSDGRVLGPPQGTLGPLLGYPETVVMKAGGRLFRLWVEPKGLRTNNSVFYESTDCTGPAFIRDFELDFLLTQANIAPPGLTVYLPDPNAPRLQMVAHSNFTADEDGCSQSFDNDTFVPAVAVTTLDAYRPPFRIPEASPITATGYCGDCNNDRSVIVNELVTAVNAALTGCPAENAIRR